MLDMKLEQPAVESVSVQLQDLRPHVGSGVVKIDPLCFLAGCSKRRLNQT